MVLFRSDDQTGVPIGTPAYMAPEALAGTFDHRSDLYSLGCVLYEMVTGCRPFTGTSWHVVNQHLNEQPAPLRTLRPDTPVELERLVSQLLAKDPAQCPDSADGVCELLEEINDRHFGDAPPSRGSDITSEVVISHAEAAEGAVIPLRFTTHRSCPACATREDEQAARACPTCRGKDGLSTSSTPARSASPCGIRNQQQIRVREFGGPGKHGGAPGDLYVTVHVQDWTAARYSARPDGFVPFVSDPPPTSLWPGYTEGCR